MSVGATAHKVLIDFTGENVRSYPATAVVFWRECFAIVAATSRGPSGARPCSAWKNATATWVRTLARSSIATG